MKKITAIVLGLTCMLLLNACNNTDVSKESTADSIVSNVSAEDTDSKSAYSAFLSGDRTLLQTGGFWIPDFQNKDMAYEYMYLDLDEDGTEELIVQMEDDPYGYNAVFYFENGNIYCWNSDAVEITCADYPLSDGTMVREYNYSGSCTYTIFRYRANGETENISCLFEREESYIEDNSVPCPYYEIDGKEVDKTAFEERLAVLITDRMPKRQDWTKLEILNYKVIDKYSQ